MRELPAGTTQADVQEVVALRTPVTETGASLTVSAVTRAFLLQDDYLPGPSFAGWTGATVLTEDSPEAVLWSAGG